MIKKVLWMKMNKSSCHFGPHFASLLAVGRTVAASRARLLIGE